MTTRVIPTLRRSGLCSRCRASSLGRDQGTGALPLPCGMQALSLTVCSATGPGSRKGHPTSPHRPLPVHVSQSRPDRGSPGSEKCTGRGLGGVADGPLRLPGGERPENIVQVFASQRNTSKTMSKIKREQDDGHHPAPSPRRASQRSLWCASSRSRQAQGNTGKGGAYLTSPLSHP